MKKLAKFRLIVIAVIVLCLTAILLVACNDLGDTPNLENFTVKYEALQGGSITGETEQSVKFGDNGTEVTAVPDIGYKFVRWSDGKTDTTRVEENVVENITITAEFKKCTYTVEYRAEEGGSILGNAVQTVKFGENATMVTAVASEGYEFVRWSDGKVESERMDISVKSNKLLTAKFKKKVYFVHYTAQTGGYLSGSLFQTLNYGQTGTGVRAIPDFGYEFVKWSDGVTDDFHISFTVKDDLVITAEFRKQKYTLQYETDGNGTIQGDANQSVKYKENGTSVTAIPNEHYEFERWSDGVKTATREDTDVVYNKCVTAFFKKQTFTVRYDTNDTWLGLIKDLDTNFKSGFFEFQVEYGENAPNVLTYSRQNELNEDYEFLYWSDGVTTRERQDTNITSDMTFTAYYGYKIDYIINGNVGGEIIGKATQQVLSGEIGEEVRAVEKDGYVFMGWSDLSWEKTRQDNPNRSSKDSCRNLELIAYFEPIKKTFTYDYGYDLGAPFATAQITLNRNSIEDAEFAVPTRDGYAFCGWYADRDYRIRITTDTGRYMYGYASFSLETDTLYARWEKENERTDNHKILMVFVDKVQTTLYSKRLGKDVDIDTTMTALDYQLCNSTATIMSNLLNEWFEGNVIFEVDSYYTTRTITEGFKRYGGGADYALDAYNINEVCDVMYLYHNTLTVVGIDDFGRDLISSSGLAYIKDAFVTKDHEWALVKYGNRRLQDYIYERNNGVLDLNQTIVETCLHELIHTAESNFEREDHLDLHDAIGYVLRNHEAPTIMNTLKPCLLGEFEMDGTTLCVPMNYWKHDMDIHIAYVDSPVNQKTAGSIKVLGEDPNPDSTIWWVSTDVPYGSDFAVEAIPKTGYRFVRWSDGVTTAIRHDNNIIAYFCVEAIFEKI